MAASAGGIEAVTTILHALPSEFPAAIVLVQHRSPSRPSLLKAILARHTTLRVADAEAGATLERGHVYIARSDQHLTVNEERRFAYVDGRRIRHVLSSANPLFISVAARFGPSTIGVVLSGSGSDGTDGVQSIKAQGGTVIAQDERTAQHFGMPGAAIQTGAVDYVLPVDEIAPALVRLASGERPRRAAVPSG
jgi:two-component system chemotaxis response regulator CheB